VCTEHLAVAANDLNPGAGNVLVADQVGMNLKMSVAGSRADFLMDNIYSTKKQFDAIMSPDTTGLLGIGIFVANNLIIPEISDANSN
jgi:hypothetical protein